MGKYKIGDFIKFGKYPNGKYKEIKKIEWEILDIKSDNALLISRYGIDTKPYNKAYMDVTWEKSTIRKWLNNEFFDEAFSEEEKTRIKKVKVINEYNKRYGTNGGEDTLDRVFLLSIEEAKKYLRDGDTLRPTDYALLNHAMLDNYENSCFWLRTPGTHQDEATFVDYEGHIRNFGIKVNFKYYLVRPAMWISFNELGKKDVGDHLTFGRYMKELNGDFGDIEWQVLDKEDNKLFIISKYLLDVKPYNIELKEITWEKSTLRKWLNIDFLNIAFNNFEKEKIIASNETNDKIFILNKDETKKYFKGSTFKCKTTKYLETKCRLSDDDDYAFYWLRNSGYKSTYAAIVGDVGLVSDFGFEVDEDDICVRPAMWIECE